MTHPKCGWSAWLLKHTEKNSVDSMSRSRDHARYIKLGFESGEGAGKIQATPFVMRQFQECVNATAPKDVSCQK